VTCIRLLATVSNPRRSSVRPPHGVPRDQQKGNDRAAIPDTSSHIWGEPIKIPKPEEVVRYIFANIQGLPVNPTGHKHHQISVALQDTEGDVMGMAELNLNFGVLGPAHQWTERFRQMYRNHSIHTYNRHDSSKKRILFGGTAQISIGACSHRAIASGTDTTGMGRWVWTLYAGRNETKLRIISGYRPNPDQHDRPGTVYSQQERYLRSIYDYRNPRRAFIKDLEAQLETWQAEGNLIILGLDATNDKVRTGEVNSMLRNQGLKDVHATRHPNLPTEATCNKNVQDILGRHMGITLA
jgi:hypothetical protein